MSAKRWPSGILEKERKADLAADPFVQFRRWLEEAFAAGLPQPDAYQWKGGNPSQ